MATEDMRDQSLDKAILAVGGVTELARLITEVSPEKQISPQGVSKWRKCPSERVLQVEKVTGVSRHELRSDLYPVEVV